MNDIVRVGIGVEPGNLRPMQYEQLAGKHHMIVMFGMSAPIWCFNVQEAVRIHCGVMYSSSDDGIMI